MFEALSERLAAALKKISGRGVLRPEDVDAGLREVRLALLEADVNFKVVKEFVEKVRVRLAGAEVSPGLTAPQTVIKAVHDELVELLGANAEGLRYKAQPPTVLMLIGLQGSGKTTTAVKLALLARREGHRPLVAASMTGQEAVKVGEAFGRQVGVHGVIMTKLDGDARGGAALSLRVATGEQIRFAGTGEKPADLEVFHAERMASRILGMGDVLSLIEKAGQTVDREKAAEVERHLRAGQLSFDDFLAQIRQLRDMGPLEGLLDMVPGGGQLKGQLAGANTELEMKRMEAIILSMTPRERAHPELIDGARKRRIARGSGVQPADINRLLKARDAMQKMAKQFGAVSRKGKLGGIPRLGQIG